MAWCLLIWQSVFQRQWFSQIPAGQKTLLIVYGFEQEDAAGPPIGVACKALEVPERGATTMMTAVSGGDMLSLR